MPPRIAPRRAVSYNGRMTIGKDSSAASLLTSVVIQAGGRSSRMGRDKGLVELAGRPLVTHVFGAIGGLADEVLLTTNAPGAYAFLGLRMASDEVPGAGALPGLRTALSAARGQHVLVVACDMPFLNRPLLAYLLDLACDGSDVDVVVPRWDGRYQTMHAVYRRDTCLRAVDAALARGDKRMVSFYSDVAVCVVSESEVARFDRFGRTFFNVNTPTQLAEAQQMARTGGP